MRQSVLLSGQEVEWTMTLMDWLDLAKCWAKCCFLFLLILILNVCGWASLVVIVVWMLRYMGVDL